MQLMQLLKLIVMLHPTGYKSYSYIQMIMLVVGVCHPNCMYYKDL